LYGVDIDPGAVEIAKLRLWLSLVVDEDDIKEIKPLPNLDYKIMQGDSLVEEFEGVKLFDKRMVEQPSLDLKAKKAALNARISELSRQFFDLHGRGNRDKPTRRAIEKEIDKLKKEMKALDTPVTASSLPTQREIGDLFSEAQCKLPELEHLHRQLFEASSGTLKKEIREKLTSLEWVIIEATVSDGIQQVRQKLDHLKQELDNSKRKKEPAKILQSLERKLNEMKAQKKEREDAAKHLESLRNASVKPFFLWRLHFLEVFQQKDGFDAVVSNPPYVLLQDSNRNVQLYKRFRDSYTVAAYKIDLYHLFIERAVHLLNSDGSVAFITPSNFTSNNYAVALRRFLLEETELRQLIFFDDDVFEASVNNVVFIAQRNGQLDSQVLFYRGKIAEQELSLQLKTQITQSDLVTEMCLLIPAESSGAAVLVDKLLRDRPPLGEIASVNFGMQLRDRSKFPNDVIKDPRKSELSKYHRPCYTGKDIRRYMVEFDGRYCYFNREAQRGGCWDEYIHKAKNKILVRQIGAYPEGGLDTNGYAVLNTAFIIVPRNGKTDPLWLLGILNSSCLRFFWLNRFRDDRKTFPKIKGEYLKLIPIPNEIDKALNHKLVQLVRQMITAKKEWAATEDDYEKRRLGLFCADLDREIDSLVYKLYELTDDEIATVEANTQKAK
ncbi:MAG: Eco57I restriction-modification methylase domain-containing protein, partial [Acidobacteria bacterium]|nr:Eco57I restriction-modification methylase domain-containing protein [Acidobacteriota bacterium]